MLQSKLDAMREEFESSLDDDKVALMHRSTEDLRASGVLDKVVKPGDPAPPFELPTADGETASLEGLLKQGWLILSFYRGVW